ncbi:hypothetical protein KJ693_06540 [bacterium]|nr:hypothetical protein [bacterium]MBU1614958.1 hypothetical protein [bacterium]
MEAVIHNGQITLPEKILKQFHLPKESKCELLVGAREIRIHFPHQEREQLPEAIKKVIKHLAAPPAVFDIEDIMGEEDDAD